MREVIEGIQSNSDVPWWVKAIFMLGVPSAIAVYLVYSLVSGIVPAMISMQATMSNLVVAVSTISADHVQAKAQNENILRVLRASCVNAATTSLDRERCLQ